jgi:TPR repeat protein
MNKRLAIRYFKLSADQGNADGQSSYGLCLVSGIGVPMDKSLGAHYLRLSADQGHPDDQVIYGMYLNGEGDPMNNHSRRSITNRQQIKDTSSVRRSMGVVFTMARVS